jgi:N-acetylglucosamine-6-sulfatase
MRVDHDVDELFEWLKSQHSFDPSMIVVTADHGESFHRQYGSHTGPLLTEELIRVPLIVKLPQQMSGNHSEVLAEQADLVPSLLAWSAISPSSLTEGRVIPQKEDADHQHCVYSMSFEQIWRFGPLTAGTVAAICGHWKYVHYMPPLHYYLMPELKDELYDVVADPHEQDNLADRLPGQASSMRIALESEIARHNDLIH